jgi:hypothetical protein
MTHSKNNLYFIVKVSGLRVLLYWLSKCFIMSHLAENDKSRNYIFFETMPLFSFSNDSKDDKVLIRDFFVYQIFSRIIKNQIQIKRASFEREVATINLFISAKIIIDYS